MRICAAWLLQHAAVFLRLSRSSWESQSVFMSGRCSLTPILRSLGRGFLARTRYLYFNVDDTASAARRDAAKALWRMRRNWSRTRLKPCSPWVIINTGCCVITGLPKPRSSRVSKDVTRQQRGTIWPSALVARREGHWDQSIAYFEQALALDPRNVELLSDAA